VDGAGRGQAAELAHARRSHAASLTLTALSPAAVTAAAPRGGIARVEGRRVADQQARREVHRLHASGVAWLPRDTREPAAAAERVEQRRLAHVAAAEQADHGAAAAANTHHGSLFMLRGPLGNLGVAVTTHVAVTSATVHAAAAATASVAAVAVVAHDFARRWRRRDRQRRGPSLAVLCPPHASHELRLLRRHPRAAHLRQPLRVPPHASALLVTRRARVSRSDGRARVRRTLLAREVGYDTGAGLCINELLAREVGVQPAAARPGAGARARDVHCPADGAEAEDGRRVRADAAKVALPRPQRRLLHQVRLGEDQNHRLAAPPQRAAQLGRQVEQRVAAVEQNAKDVPRRA